MPDSAPDPLDPPAAPRLTVVIVNYNGWPDVAKLVATLSDTAEVRSGRCEVVVVDNASDGPIPASLTRPARGVRLIERPDNGGFAVGVNAGWRASRSPWLLLLNPDVEAGPRFLARVLERIEHHERRAGGPPGIVGFALKNADGSPQPSVGAEPGLLRSLLGQFRPRSRRKYRGRSVVGEVPWVTGACLLIDSGLMRHLGGLDEDFFLYYEEVALCRSARAAGRRVEYDDAASVVHLRPLQARAIAPKMRVIVRHAKLLFFRKHQPRWQFRALCAIVAIEAWGRARGSRRAEEAEAWRAIGRLARAMQFGGAIRGREVLALAEEATSAPLSPRERVAAQRPGEGRGVPARPRGRAEPLIRPSGTFSLGEMGGRLGAGEVDPADARG